MISFVSYCCGHGLQNPRDRVNLSERNLKEAKFTDYICNQKRSDALISYVDKPNINTVLSKLSYERTLIFIDTFGKESVSKFADEPQLIIKWKRYYDELIFRNEFIQLNKNDQIEFLKCFGSIEKDLFDQFKTKPYLFERFKNANASSKLLAKNKPHVWIRLNKFYQRPSDLLERLSSSYISSKFGHDAVRLENIVETEAQELISTLTRNKRGEYVLVSAMVDKETGKLSEVFKNFSKEELKNGTYRNYLEEMHPNLKTIVTEINNAGQSVYNMDDMANLVFTGKNIAAHAEVRALNDLANKRFGNNLVDKDLFNYWLKNNVLAYNRNIVAKPESSKIIMHTCADCFYITDLVTFIK